MLFAILPALLLSSFSLNDSMPSGYFGITASPNISFLIVDYSKKGLSGSPKFGYSLGIFANHYYEKVGLKAELLLNNKHVKLNEYGYISDLYFRTISIPLMVRFRKPNHIIQFNFNFGLSPEITINSVRIYSPFTIGLPFSFGTDFLTRNGIFSIELRNTINVLKSTEVERFDVLYLLLNYGFAYPKAILQKEIIEEK